MLSWQSIFAVALALGSQVAARPAPLVVRDVSSDLLARFNLIRQFATASYCAANHNSTGTKLVCASGNCPLVQADNTKTLDEFEDTVDYGDTTGYLAVDETNELIVLSFRGSSSVENWIADLDFIKTDVDLCDGCEAHGGFWKSWESVAGQVTAHINSALSTYPGYTLVITGHSLGAAVATLAGTVLRNAGHSLELYTFGSPRVGNKALATYITSQSASTWRITHTDDPVPKLPPKLNGFSQPSPEYWITSATNAAVTKSDITVVTGIDSKAGNDGTAIGLDTAAHGWYLGAISNCG